MNSKAGILTCILVLCMGVASYGELCRLTKNSAQNSPFDEKAIAKAKAVKVVNKYRVINQASQAK